METRDIHRYEQQVNTLLVSVRRDQNIRERDKKTILQAYEYMRATGLSCGRIAQYLRCMRDIARMNLPNSLKRLDQKDVIEIAKRISHYSYHTKIEYKKTISLLSKISKKNIPKLPVTPSHKRILPRFLTPEQVREILGVLEGEYRLLAWFLWDTGARIGEALNLRACDVLPDEYGARVVLYGKTGMRIVRLLECHKEIVARALSIPQEERVFDISYHQFAKALWKTSRRLGIRITPYSFRHSRATFLARYLTEFQMCAYFGWQYGSKIPSVYVHLSGRDIEKTLIQKVPIVIRPNLRKEILFSGDL